MAIAKLTVRIRMAWWLKPYCYGLAIFATLTGAEPDWDRVKRVVTRGVTAEVRGARPSFARRIWRVLWR